MPTASQRQAGAVLALLLSGVLCTASVVPFMGVFIVETLGREPWMISLYAVVTLTLSVIVNRQYGEWIDGGMAVAPLVQVSIAAFALGALAILMFPSFGVLMTVASPCFAVAGAAVSTMYSFGRMFAETNGLNVPRYNSYLRATTSLGWMIAPAVAFFVASVWDGHAVFRLALGLCAIWLLMWWLVMPRDFAKPGGAVQEGGPYRRNRPLLLAAGVCLAFAMAHSMSMSALPLYYIREAGLPEYAPGISLSVKTLVEIAAILATPLMMAWLGARNALRLAAVLAVAAFVVLSRVTTLPQLVFGAALEGLYYGIFAAIGLTYMQDFARGRLARATSLYMNSLFVGGVLASPMMGLVAQFVSFGAAIQLASVWAVLGFGVLTYMSPGRLEQ